MRSWICLVVLVSGCKGAPQRTCRELVQAQSWDAAYTRCNDELAGGGDPQLALEVATAAMFRNDRAEVIRLASPLVSGPRGGDALFLLGASALRDGDRQLAREQLQAAMKFHVQAGNFAAQARDAQQLTGASFELGDLRAAADFAAVASAAAARAGDTRMQVYCDLAQADFLRAIGRKREAEAVIERAVAGARDPGDLALARFKQGTVYFDQGHLGLARSTFERALIDELGGPGRPSQLVALHLNLAHIERRSGKPAEALARLEIVRQLMTHEATDEMWFRLSRGMVLADLDRLPEAMKELAAAEATSPVGEWAWFVPHQMAMALAKAGDREGAIAADRRAIDKVTELAASSGVFGPSVIANHREPHLHLIGMLADQQRWAGVLEIVALLDAQSLLDSPEAPRELGPSDSDALTQPAHPRGELGAATSVVDAWRGRRLVVVAPGGADMWRLDIHDGELVGSRVGEVETLERLARRLESDPGDAEAGEQLGGALLPEVPEGTRLELVTVGPLARAPLASLRRAGQPAIARLQLVRAAGVLPRIHASGARTATRAVVLGDPNGDLPGSAAEARQVAARLGATPLVGPAANRAAFAAAGGADVFHVSGHTSRDFDGVRLSLSDGSVTLGDIAGLSPSPRLVVLASCGAAAGRDDTGGGSLALAFLDAGTDVVLATKWSIGDADAAPLVEAFYAAGGRTDPVRALATAQTNLAAKVSSSTWAAFEITLARPVRR